jgi:hypothetical protein
VTGRTGLSRGSNIVFDRAVIHSSVV